MIRPRLSARRAGRLLGAVAVIALLVTTGTVGAQERPTVAITPGSLDPVTPVIVYPRLSHSGQFVSVTGFGTAGSGASLTTNATFAAASVPVQAVGVIDQEGPSYGLVQGSYGTISGDGCVLVSVRNNELRWQDRCLADGEFSEFSETDFERIEEQPQGSLDPEGFFGLELRPPVVSFDGRTVAVTSASEQTVPQLFWFRRGLDDTWTRRTWTPLDDDSVEPMALTGEMDMSDDGQSLVLAARTFLDGEGFIACDSDVRSDRLMHWQPETQPVPVPLVTTDRDATNRFLGQPSMSGDGRWIIWLGQQNSDDGHAVWIADVLPHLSGQPIVPRRLLEGAGFASISPDGAHVVAIETSDICADALGPVKVLYGDQPGLAGVVNEEFLGEANIGNTLPFNNPVISELGRWIAFTDLIVIDGGPTTANVRALQRPAAMTIDQLDFGTVSVNSVTERAAIVRNTGTSSVRLALASATDQRFTVALGQCGAVILYPGTSCALQVTFTAPATPGAVESRLATAEEGFAPGRATGSIRALVEDTPVTVPPVEVASLVLTPDVVTFDDTVVGASNEQIATIRNAGRISASAVLSTDDPAFVLIDDAFCSGRSLEPGEECLFTISFTPTQPGTTASNLRAVGDGISESIRLLGLGVQASVELSLDPAEIFFDNTPIGAQSTPRTVTITNNGQLETPAIATVSGAARADFSIAENGCVGLILTNGQSCSIAVRFVPREAGDRRAELLLNAGGTEGTRGVLGGTGLLDPVLRVQPNALTERQTAVVYGRGFAANSLQVLTIDPAGVTIRAVVDSEGRLRAEFTPLGTLNPGAFDISLLDPRGDFTEPPTTSFVVVPATAQPGPNWAATFNAASPGSTVLFRN